MEKNINRLQQAQGLLEAILNDPTVLTDGTKSMIIDTLAHIVRVNQSLEKFVDDMSHSSEQFQDNGPFGRAEYE